MELTFILLSVEFVTILNKILLGIIEVVVSVAIFILISRICDFFFVSKFAKKVNRISLLIDDVRKHIDELFVPTKQTTQKQIENFLIDNKNLLDQVMELTIQEKRFIREKRYRYVKIIRESNIPSFQSESCRYTLEMRKKENNKIYDAIERLKKISSDAVSKYQTLLLPNHYFAHSELKFFKNYISKAVELFNLLMPKYCEYITDEDTLELQRIINYIENDREQHNKEFVANELVSCSAYFDTVLLSYPLDIQQRESIVKLEDNCLVIASAGSGKTSTILGKAKYLIERRHIDPSKILLLTYTKKAALEFEKRMKIDGLVCGTFHSLAYHIIANVTGKAPSICRGDVSLNVFRKLIQNNSSFLHAVNHYIINQQSLMELEHSYCDSFAYFEDRKKYGIQALFPDMDGNIIFTRSEEEKRLVSLLTRLGVAFRYESNYEVDTRTPERRQYRPDFTIYYMDGQGHHKHIYLEHFSIDSQGRVPMWFGTGTKGGWVAANKKYKDGIIWKRNIHRQNGTILIETTSADFIDGTIEFKLRQQLKRYGVLIKERTDEELYELLIKRNRKLEKSVYMLIISFITLLKANEMSIDELLNKKTLNKNIFPDISVPLEERNKSILRDIIKPFYDEYQSILNANTDMDFTDSIIQATKLCRQGLWKHYDYILVDEFQDISIDRYMFLQALRSDELKTKLFCVGDDWQSIFRFAGSDISLFYKFEKYFGFTEICKIETTYRFHQPLIDKSSSFIMKNKEQRKKIIRPPQGDNRTTYMKFVKCDKDNIVLHEVESIVKTIPNTQSVLLLGRYNYDARSVGFTGNIGFNDNHIKVNICEREILFLTVHSAKGMEADHVILVNCNQGTYGFPSLIEDDPIFDFVLSKSERYPFAEERRLFYVAMTRAKKCLYVLYDTNRPSQFIGEFLIKFEVGSYLCPRCLDGKMECIKKGVNINGIKYRSFVCSNKEGGCDFFETSNGNQTPPGIQITEEMTVNDIEKLKENRRITKIIL